MNVGDKDEDEVVGSSLPSYLHSLMSCQLKCKFPHVQVPCSAGCGLEWYVEREVMPRAV